MADEKKILIDITIDAEALQSSSNKALLAITGFDKKLAELKKQREKDLLSLNAAIAAGNAKEEDDIRKRVALNEAESKSVQQSRREQIKVVQLSNDLIKDSDGKSIQSKEQLRKARQLEQIQLDQLKGTIAENAKGQIVLSQAGEQSVQQLNKYNTGLIEFGKSVNDGRNNVGNYTSSILDAVEKTGLFGGSLGTVKEAFNAVRSGAAGVQDGIIKFKEGLSQSVGVMGDWLSVTNATSDTTTKTSTATAQLGKVTTETTAKGVTGFRALTAAIASTGIGLLVIALAAALNYLRQVDPIVEKFQQIFAGIGEAITVVGKGIVDFGKDLIASLTDPIKLLETINPINIVKRIAGIGEEAVKAGVKAADLTARLQELEDLERNLTAATVQNTIEAEKNRKLSEDRTKSARERLGFLEKAQEAELKNLEIEKRVASERFKLTQAEINLKKESGTVSDELRAKYLEEAATLVKITEQINNKAASDIAEGGRIRLKLQKDQLAGTIAILNEELRALSLQGIESIELKKEIIKKQRDAELAESDLSSTQKIAIEKKYQNDLLELDKETSDFRQSIRLKAQEIAINNIIDGQTREISAESFALDAKLEAVKGNSQEEQALRIALLEESALKVLEIERKFAALSQKEKADIAKSDRDLQINQSNDTFDSIENALKISLSKKEILQSEYDARLRQLNIDRLDKELEIELQYQGLRQAQDALTFANNEAALKKQLDGRQISQEEYNKQLIELQKQFYSTQGQTEIDTQAGVNATLAELNQAKVDNQILTNDQLIAEDQRIKEAKSQLADLEKELLIQSLRNTAALIGESAKGNQAFGAFLKTLAIGEVIINLQSEISNNKKFAAVDPLNAVPGGEAIVRAKLIAKNLAATIGAGVSIAKISTQKFEEGGYSVPDMVRQYNPTFTDRPQGYVNRPTAWLNLAGEKEGEWIASGKLLRDPRTAPVIQSLEHYQRTGQRSVVRPFAGGGFTSPIIIPQGAGINATDIAAAVRAAVSDLQITPVVSVQEIVDVNQNMNNVRKVATL
jgi:hypothetical protein